MRIDFAGKMARLPVNRNLLLIDGKTVELPGVVVYASDTGKAYIPEEAAHLIMGTP